MRKTILLGLFMMMSFVGISQSSKTKILQKTYFYTFYDVQNQDEMYQMVADLEKIENVLKVKLNYKPEKNAGQVIVILNEPERTNEGQEFFSPKTIKEKLIQYHLTPGEMDFEEKEIKKN